MGGEPKRRFELAVLELLRSSLPELSRGEISHGESPDFVISRPGVRIGVEITSLHGLEPGRGSEEMRRRAASARFFHEFEKRVKATGAPCAVIVQLMGPIAGGTRRAQEVAEDAFRLLEPAIGIPGTGARWSRLDRSPGLPLEVHSLELHWPPKLPHPALIMGGESFLISDQFENPLRQVVQAKNRKIELYRQRCDECWLAVVLPHYFEAEDEGVLSPALEAVYQTQFQRVFAVDLDSGRYWELQTQRGDPGQ